MPKKVIRGWRCYARPPKASCRERSWRVVLVTPEGKRVEQATKLEDEREARRLAAEIERSYRETGAPPPARGAPPPALTVGDVVRRSILWRQRQGPQEPGCSAATIERMEDVLRYLADSLMQVETAALTRADVVRAQDELRPGRKPRTVNALMALVSSAWGWAHERGLVREPWPRARRLKALPTTKRPMTPAEVERVLAWTAATRTRARWVPLILALHDTGCRVSELLGARERDLDRTTGKLEVYSSKRRTWRTVWLAPATVAATRARRPGDWLYPSARDMNKPASRETINAHMDRACAALGIADVDVHSWRRTWVADAVRAPGVVPEQAMKLTGHADPKVFHGYQRNAEDDLEAVARRVHNSRPGRPEHLQHRRKNPNIYDASPCPHGPAGICTPNSAF